MTTIEVRPVRTRRERRIFMEFPWRIYKGDPLWTPPLIPQLKERFDPTKNPVIKDGFVEAFIAWRGNEPVGTIAAAEDTTRNAEWNEDRAMFGFFECINDGDVAAALFDAAIAWARGRGRSSLWGPWRLDYEDSHGLLVRGWELPQVIMLAHNPPYYESLIERCGLRQARRDSLAFALQRPPGGGDPMPPKLERVAQKVLARGRVGIRYASFDKWDHELEIAIDIMERGLSVLDERGFWSLERLRTHAESLRSLLDPDFIIFGTVEGKEVGWVVGMPDLNQAIRAANGLRRPWDYLTMMRAMRRRPDCISMKGIAVAPEYWNRGIDSIMVYQFARNAINKGYTWCDLSQTGEDNPMTPRLSGNLGAVEYKRFRIYEIAV